MKIQRITINLFRDDLLPSAKNLAVDELRYWHFKNMSRLWHEADQIIYTDKNGKSYSLKNKYGYLGEITTP